MKYFRRTLYINWLSKNKNTDTVKFITGIHGIGKTKLMLDYIGDIYKSESDPNVLYIDFNIPHHGRYMDPEELRKRLDSEYLEGSFNYVIIDGAQLCGNIDELVKCLNDIIGYDIYII
ncbi:MAG: AAA family ATPase, partial [Parasporobacterium sp.]|nr:AAA family ATPase [Parasporobacterium sp.]